MSGYSSLQAVREIIKETLILNKKDPADFNIAGIARDAFYYRGPGYGWGAQPESDWDEALVKHCRRASAPVVADEDPRVVWLQNDLAAAKARIAELQAAAVERDRDWQAQLDAANRNASEARATAADLPAHPGLLQPIPVDRRRELTEVTTATLDGRPATIVGYLNPFARVYDTKTGLSAEWSWKAVDQIVTTQSGRFHS